MKTISIRELHDKTGQWVRRTGEEEEIIVTDRGRAVAVLRPCPGGDKPKLSWKDRPLHPAYQGFLKSGKFRSKFDSTKAISEEREGWR